MEHVLKLAHKLKAPVLTTFKAKARSPTIIRWRPGCSVAAAPGGQLVYERERPAAGAGREFANHTGISAKTDHPGRFRRDDARQVPPVDLPVLGEIGLTAEWLWRALPEDTGSGSGA